MTFGMPIPLDSDGFLRRECPTCEREFKWLPASGEDEGSETSANGGYFCPYCGVQSPASAWLTQAQVTLAQNIVATEVVGPMLRKFTDSIKRVGRDPSGIISVDARYDQPDKADPLTETDDMTRVDFACHPSEPLKILDDWRKPVRCLICGEPNS